MPTNSNGHGSHIGGTLGTNYAKLLDARFASGPIEVVDLITGCRASIRSLSELDMREYRTDDGIEIERVTKYQALIDGIHFVDIPREAPSKPKKVASQGHERVTSGFVAIELDYDASTDSDESFTTPPTSLRGSPVDMKPMFDATSGEPYHSPPRNHKKRWANNSQSLNTICGNDSDFAFLDAPQTANGLELVALDEESDDNLPRAERPIPTPRTREREATVPTQETPLKHGYDASPTRSTERRPKRTPMLFDSPLLPSTGPTPKAMRRSTAVAFGRTFDPTESPYTPPMGSRGDLKPPGLDQSGIATAKLDPASYSNSPVVAAGRPVSPLTPEEQYSATERTATPGMAAGADVSRTMLAGALQRHRQVLNGATPSRIKPRVPLSSATPKTRGRGFGSVSVAGGGVGRPSDVASVVSTRSVRVPARSRFDERARVDHYRSPQPVRGEYGLTTSLYTGPDVDNPRRQYAKPWLAKPKTTPLKKEPRRPKTSAARPQPRATTAYHTPVTRPRTASTVSGLKTPSSMAEVKQRARAVSHSKHNTSTPTGPAVNPAVARRIQHARSMTAELTEMPEPEHDPRPPSSLSGMVDEGRGSVLTARNLHRLNGSDGMHDWSSTESETELVTFDSRLEPVPETESDEDVSNGDIMASSGKLTTPRAAQPDVDEVDPQQVDVSPIRTPVQQTPKAKSPPAEPSPAPTSPREHHAPARSQPDLRPDHTIIMDSLARGRTVFKRQPDTLFKKRQYKKRGLILTDAGLAWAEEKGKPKSIAYMDVLRVLLGRPACDLQGVSSDVITKVTGDRADFDCVLSLVGRKRDLDLIIPNQMIDVGGFEMTIGRALALLVSKKAGVVIAQ
ncbi:hypothetical protein J8273_8126 [Carpediemonas membranifera]|uniref:Uncharacterized protein n=1 Tax=Carpediemonas membranifera TaxID=201153 RepID=A0A8J6B054_9EUKA|nr:hypothetical protein J8273_8126 [Carpediemonas membranifera]|eukprot:KAG9390089.1 hypothetical protein J8273_8126 [Carpediemonas membranifera]